MPVEKPVNFKKTLNRLLRYLKPFTFRLSLVLLTSILSTGFSVLSPVIIGMVTTSLFETIRMRIQGSYVAVNFDFILRSVFILVGLYILSSTFNYIKQLIMVTISQKTVYILRN